MKTRVFIRFFSVFCFSCCGVDFVTSYFILCHIGLIKKIVQVWNKVFTKCFDKYLCNQILILRMVFFSHRCPLYQKLTGAASTLNVFQSIFFSLALKKRLFKRVLFRQRIVYKKNMNTEEKIIRNITVLSTTKIKCFSTSFLIQTVRWNDIYFSCLIIQCIGIISCPKKNV